MSSLKFYTHPYSRGRTVRWMLEEIGQPYDLEVKDFGGDIKSSAYLAINPMGKVPALVHGGTVVTEVAAICAYLADRFPEKGLAPALDSPERGVYYRWMFFIAGPFEMAATAKAFSWKIDAENAQTVGCGLIEDTVNSLEQALNAAPYICGDRFTAADVLVSSYVGWAMMQKNIDERPVFQQYVERMQSRPAAARAAALDDALAEELRSMA